MSDPREANADVRDELTAAIDGLISEVSVLRAVKNYEGFFRQRMVTLKERINDLREDVAPLVSDLVHLRSEEQARLMELCE